MLKSTPCSRPKPEPTTPVLTSPFLTKMDHPSWHWKRSSVSMDSDDSLSTHSSSRHMEDQDIHSIPVNVSTLRGNAVQTQQLLSLGVSKYTNENSSKTLLNIFDIKGDLAEKHAKVTEEAIKGWEKAEEQKLAAEDRVSHLDEALKECMKQLRCVREEQEQRIHEAIIKKTREWDLRQCELEAKLQDADRRLFEAESKNKVLSKSLLQDARGPLHNRVVSAESQSSEAEEGDTILLRLQLETVEKEKSSFENEIMVLKKELELYKGEREALTKDAIEKFPENTFKAEKTEVGCLRLHTQKRPESPNRPWKEAKRLGGGHEDSGRWQHSINGYDSTTTIIDYVHEFAQIGNMSKEHLLERMHAMEKETKTLKELLDRRNKELEDARVINTGTTANIKLSIAEGQPRSFGSTANRDKECSSKRIPGVCSLDLMDDFVEMEKMLSDNNDLGRESISENLFRDLELQTGNEERLAFLQSKNEVNEKALASLREKLDNILKKKDEGDDITIPLLELKSILEESHCSSATLLISNVMKLSSRCPSNEITRVTSHQGSEPSVGFDSREISSEEDGYSSSMSDNPIIVHQVGLKQVSSIGKSSERACNGYQSNGGSNIQCESVEGDSMRAVFGNLIDNNGRAINSMTVSLDVAKLSEELRKVETEKEALEHLLQESSFKTAEVESELAKIKMEKMGADNDLKSCRDYIECLKTQLCDKETSVAHLQSQLNLDTQQKQLISQQLSDIETSKQALEIQLTSKEEEIEQLHRKVKDLEERLVIEQDKCNEADASGASMRCSRCLANQEEPRLKKECEIALATEKLAECQRTILTLGKQLKELVKPKIATESCFDDMALPPGMLSKNGRDNTRMSEKGGGSPTDSEEGEERVEEDSRACGFQSTKALEMLDSELASLAVSHHPPANPGSEMFGDRTPVHEDFIEAVAQMSSSPEMEQPSLSPSLAKLPVPTEKTRRSSLSSSRIDSSKATYEKHGSSSFSRFFSRTRSSKVKI